MKEKIVKLIEHYKNELIEIEQNRESDDKAGDHSFFMAYDTAKSCINQFIKELNQLKTEI